MNNYKNNSPYTAAITRGGFLYEETIALLPLFQSPDRVALLKDEKVNNRLLKINAETSRKKAINEIACRYDAVSSSFWNDYLEMGEDDQKAALFLVILEMIDIFDDLAAKQENYGVEFTYHFDADHDRFIQLDNGWKIVLSRGLEIFDKYSRFSLSNTRQANRRCREFSITYIQE